MLLLIAFAGALAEFELGAGLARSLEPLYYSDDGYPTAAALYGRLAIDLPDHLSAGVGFVGIPGREASKDLPCCGSNSGAAAFKAAAGFALLRLHTAGDLQLWAEAGAGPGHLISLQENNSFEHPPLRGHSGPAFLIATGVRFRHAGWLYGAGLSWLHWTRVEQAENAGCCIRPAQFGLSTSALLVLLTIGYSP